MNTEQTSKNVFMYNISILENHNGFVVQPSIFLQLFFHLIFILPKVGKNVIKSITRSFIIFQALLKTM